MLAVIYIGFVPVQSDFRGILMAYTVAFGSYFIILKKTEGGIRGFHWIIFLALVARFVLIFSEPNLSDDIYRFAWDGLLMHQGIHPLSYTPEELMTMQELEYPPGLFDKLNSQQYHTVYPPLSQAVFYVSAFGGLTSFSFILKSCLFLSECGLLVLLLKLLRIEDLPGEQILIYWLNPLVIVETMGNAHFESLCILMFLVAILLIHKNKNRFSAAAIAAAVAVKLFPLMFIPFFKNFFKHSSAFVRFGLWAGAFILIFFIPFLWGLDLLHFLGSIDLYYQKFEFNASVYFLLREAGIIVTGYNQIWIIGPMLAMMSFLLIMRMAWRSSQRDISGVLELCAQAFVLYLLLGTTVHPWYLLIPLCLSVFRPRAYILAWSYCVIFSYSLYDTEYAAYHYYLLAIEYLLVGLVWIWERNGKQGFLYGNKKTLAG